MKTETNATITSNTPIKQLIEMQKNLSEKCTVVNIIPKVQHGED